MNMNMKEIVTTDITKCEGCNRCVRVCPVSEANIAFVRDKKIKVHVDTEKCIACGSCIAVCQHGARGYEDDTERFFTDLKNGASISLLVAPAVRANFKNWPDLLAWLKSRGVSEVFDVSLGADICTWAHIRYIQKEKPAMVITQPCPAIVNYVDRYRTDLIDHLSPVQSPMLCTAVFMKKYMNNTDRIAALSPCIGKRLEFDDTRLVDYNVTFKKLSEYLEQHQIRIPKAPFSFDHIDSSLGRIYSMPGGLKENIEYYLGKAIRVDKSEGQAVIYRQLDMLSEESPENLPQVFDVLNCAEGCNAGTGCARSASPFQISRVMEDARQQALQMYPKTQQAKMTEMFERFDRRFALSDFLRSYTRRAVYEIPCGQGEVEKAFEALGKVTPEQRGHNCYACGSNTCREMAVRIAKGINVPQNCIEKTRQDILREHQAFIRERENSISNAERIFAEVGEIQRLFSGVLSGISHVSQTIEQFEQMANAISHMAMQTKILSLNASVEAVRAGAAGKGFNVVAESIRNLAAQSQETVVSTEETSVSAKKAIDAIARTTGDVDASIARVVQYADEISSSLKCGAMQ